MSGIEEWITTCIHMRIPLFIPPKGALKAIRGFRPRDVGALCRAKASKHAFEFKANNTSI